MQWQLVTSIKVSACPSHRELTSFPQNQRKRPHRVTQRAEETQPFHRAFPLLSVPFVPCTRVPGIPMQPLTLLNSKWAQLLLGAQQECICVRHCVQIPDINLENQ